MNSSAKTEVSSETSAEIKNETGARSGDNSKPESSRKADDKHESKSEIVEKNDVKSESKEDSSSSTIYNQMFLASSGKPAPKQTPATQTTELRVSLCWETMNKDNKNALINGNSDFGQLNFESWDFGSTLDASRQDVKDAFSKIKFQIKDTTDNKIVATTTGTYDATTATSATKSLGSYDSSHEYEVSVVNSTIPSPYYVTYNNVSADEGDEFTPSVSNFTWTPANGSNKAYQNKYFRLNALEIVYAKDESVADKCFSYEQPKKENGDYRSDGDWKFTYNNDNIFKRLRVDNNAIQFPKDKDGNLIHPVKAGFKFAGWQFYVARKTNGIAYTSYDRMSDDDKKIINSTTVAYVPFNAQTITYPYLFAVLRDNKGVNTFGSKLGTQYCSTNHTFVVFPKWEVAGYTVTFMNGNTQYKQVKVQENKSIDSDEWTDQSMPQDPTKDGFTFKGWNTQADGLGSKFLASTKVSGDLTVYSIFKDYPPVITVQNKTITEGDSLDLNSLVVSANDQEDGDLKNKVQITNNGGFDNSKVGSYKITFSVTDKGGASATAAATVTVTKKPTPPTPPTPPEPEPTPVPVPDVSDAPDDSWIPLPEIVPENPEYSVEQRFKAVDAGEDYNAKVPAKHLPDTGVSATSTFAISIVSLFVGFSSFLAGITKRKN